MSAKQDELVRQLLMQTRQGKLAWVDSYAGQYLLALSESSLLLVAAPITQDVMLQVRDAKGTVVRQIGGMTLGRLMRQDPDGSVDPDLLRQLFEAVRASVTAVADRALDSILQELKRK
jgi:hypothetical protein